IGVSSGFHLRSLGARTLCLLAAAAAQPVRALAVRLPARAGAAPVSDVRTRRAVGEAEFRGRGGRGQLTLPRQLLPESSRLFAKIERRYGFFDEAGWREFALEPESP
ncbi:MAG TPA: hypothetical protein VED41_08140, partial [Solirubrobacteraceae bacterium]|nr:hypothetical protein [Solirubrobacteraceae bacterium]